MEAMRKSWTDERLDDFRADIGLRFNEVNRRIDEFDERVDKRFDKVETELHRVNDRLDVLSKAMIFAAISMTTGILASYAAIIALVVTRT
jgi:hypothetical protein